EVDWLDDFYPPSGAEQRALAQRRLVDLARQLLPDSQALHEQLDELLAGQVSLGMLTDVFAFTLGFSPAVKQRPPAEGNGDRLAAILCDKLTALAEQLQRAPASDVVAE